MSPIHVDSGDLEVTRGYYEDRKGTELARPSHHAGL